MLRLRTVLGLAVLFSSVLACGAGAAPITYNIVDHGTALQNGFTLSGNITIDDANNNGIVDMNEITDYTITVSSPAHADDLTFHNTSDQLVNSHDLLVTPTMVYLHDVFPPSASQYAEISSSDGQSLLQFKSLYAGSPQQELYYFNNVTHGGFNTYSSTHEFGSPDYLVASVPEPNLCGFLGLLCAVTGLLRRK